MEGDRPGTSHRPGVIILYIQSLALWAIIFNPCTHRRLANLGSGKDKNIFRKLRITSCWSQAKKYRFDFSTKILRNMLVIVHRGADAFSSHPVHIQIDSLQASCQLYKKIFLFIYFIFFTSLYYFCFFLSGQVWLLLYGILSLRYSGKWWVGIEHANKILPLTVLKSYPAQAFFPPGVSMFIFI